MRIHHAYKLLILIGCLMPGLIRSQKLVFCDWVRPEGKPMQVYSTAEIERFGRFIFLHYTSDTLLDTQPLYFYIDRQWEGKWFPEDLVSVKPGLGEKTAWHLYHFRKPGNFRVMAVNHQLDTLATHVLELILPDHELGTQYYAECETQTAATLADAEIEHFSHQFKIQPNGKKAPKATFRVILQQTKPFSIEQLKIDLWQQTEEGKPFKTYKGETTYKVDPNWTDFQFQFEIDTPGNYRLMIYTGSGIFITHQDVEIVPMIPEGGL